MEIQKHESVENPYPKQAKISSFVRKSIILLLSGVSIAGCSPIVRYIKPKFFGVVRMCEFPRNKTKESREAARERALKFINENCKSPEKVHMCDNTGGFCFQCDRKYKPGDK